MRYELICALLRCSVSVQRGKGVPSVACAFNACFAARTHTAFFGLALTLTSVLPKVTNGAGACLFMRCHFCEVFALHSQTVSRLPQTALSGKPRHIFLFFFSFTWPSSWTVHICVLSSLQVWRVTGAPSVACPWSPRQNSWFDRNRKWPSPNRSNFCES